MVKLVRAFRHRWRSERPYYCAALNFMDYVLITDVWNILILLVQDFADRSSQEHILSYLVDARCEHINSFGVYTLK